MFNKELAHGKIKRDANILQTMELLLKNFSPANTPNTMDGLQIKPISNSETLKFKMMRYVGLFQSVLSVKIEPIKQMLPKIKK